MQHSPHLWLHFQVLARHAMDNQEVSPLYHTVQSSSMSFPLDICPSGQSSYYTLPNNLIPRLFLRQGFLRLLLPHPGHYPAQLHLSLAG